MSKNNIVQVMDAVAEELEARGEFALEAIAAKIAEDLLAESELSPEQKEYRAFFEKKLKKYNVKSPSELSDEDKKKFFDEVEKEWTKDSD
jgi:hypothetical protein